MYVIKSIAIFPYTYCYFQQLLIEYYKITLDFRLKLSNNSLNIKKKNKVPHKEFIL